MKKISPNHLFLGTIVLCTIAGIAYSFLTPKIYISKSHVAIFRMKIENPDISSEESRNRWVWIRDGLNLKSALVTDEMLASLIETNTKARELAQQFPNKQLMMNYLNGLINIQFTGADENNFLVEVKAPSPTLAFELNSKIFERIKFLAVEADQANFNAVLVELKKKQMELQLEPETYAFYQDKIRKMIFNQIVEQKQRETSFQIISKPTINEKPIWPNTKLIIILSAFIGIVVGFGLRYTVKFYQREK